MIQSVPSRAAVIVSALEGDAYREVARVLWSDGAVSVGGEPAMVEELSDGIPDPVLRERMMPSDGYGFLIAVLNQFQSPYLVATLEAEDTSTES